MEMITGYERDIFDLDQISVTDPLLKKKRNSIGASEEDKLKQFQISLDSKREIPSPN